MDLVDLLYMKAHSALLQKIGACVQILISNERKIVNGPPFHNRFSRFTVDMVDLLELKAHSKPLQMSCKIVIVPFQK